MTPRRLSQLLEGVSESVKLPDRLFHGSPRKFDKFSLDYFGRVDAGYYGVGIYLSPSIEGANDYGTWIYEVMLRDPKPFFLWDDSTMGNTYPARKELSRLPEYAELIPDLRLPDGYEVVEAEDEGNGYRPAQKGWKVTPKPEMYDDPDVRYGQMAPSREEAIVAFTDEAKFGWNSGPAHCGWTNGLLKYVGRKQFSEVLAKNGYNCLCLYDTDGVSEVLVVDPEIIEVGRCFHQRNKYDVYEHAK